MNNKFLYVLFLFTVISLKNYSQVNFNWKQKIGNENQDFGRTITVNPDGSTISAGQFNDTLDADPGANVYNLNATPGTHTVLLKLNNNGGFVWAKSLISKGHVIPSQIKTDSIGNIYVVGVYKDTTDFDPGPNVNNLVYYNNNGNFDGVFLSKYDSNGNFIWAKHIAVTGITGASYIKFEISFVLDRLHNIYISGTFNGTVDFDPGPGVFNLNSPSIRNIFLSKLDAAGNFVWAKSIESLYPQAINHITIDSDDNLLLAGSFGFGSDFDMGPGVYYLNVTVTGMADNLFLAKYNQNGNLIWAKHLKSNGNENHFINSVARDAFDNIFITGTFSDTLDFDPSANNYLLWSNYGNGNSNAFYAKYDKNGNFIWAKQLGGYLNYAPITPYSIATDAAGQNIYVSGWYNHTIDFDPGPGVVSMTPPGFYFDDGFILKADSLGNFVWVGTLGGDQFDYIHDMQIGGQKSIYLVGGFMSKCDLDPVGTNGNDSSEGSYDYFIVKLSDTNMVMTLPLSTEQWDKQSILCYPNPNHGSFKLNNVDNCSLELYDLKGTQLFQKDNIPPNSTIDVSFLQNGIYVVLLKVDKQKMAYKIEIKH